MHTGDITPGNKTRGDLARLFEALDERSRAILWHLWWHRHAQISELGSLIDVASDYEILSRLKEVINRKAQELLGRTVVSFEESKTDPFTGKKVLFSWWFQDGEDITVNGRDNQFVDIFNEKDSVTIVAQMPARGSSSLARMDSKYCVPEFRVKDVGFKNGVLQIRLERVRE